jgi:hypothetical protein
MCLTDMDWKGVDRTDLAQDKNEWRALVFHKMGGGGGV